MADKCVSAIKACRIRITRLDSCGSPVVGAKSVITSAGFISVGAAADIEAGQEFLQKNACGELCINEKDCDILKRYNLTMAMCQIDPTLVEMTTSQRLLLSGTDAIGFALGSDIQCDEGWSLELWQKLTGQDCAGGAQEWLYWAFPWVSHGAVGDLTFEDGPFSVNLTASTKGVGGDDTWGADNRGPFAVLPVGAGLLRGEHVASIVTTVQPPAAVCGAVAYVAPGA